MRRSSAPWPIHRCARNLRISDRKSIHMNGKRRKRWTHFRRPSWKSGCRSSRRPISRSSDMQLRVFGRTGMRLSVLGFGCGAVGGFMVRGDPAEQERTVARALAAGVNYFDTAVQYGDGESEKNLGRVLQKLKPANAIVGTKVRLPPGDFGRIAEAV